MVMMFTVMVMLMVTMMVLREQAGCYYPALVANRYERNLKSPSATLTAPTDDDERMQKVSPGVRNLKQWQKELVPCDLPSPPNPLPPLQLGKWVSCMGHTVGHTTLIFQQLSKV